MPPIGPEQIPAPAVQTIIPAAPGAAATPEPPATLEPTATPEPIPPTATPSPTPAPLTPAPALRGTFQHFAQIGHTALGSRGWHGGLALQDRCAYVGNRSRPAVAIVDISDPAQPAPVGQIEFGWGAQPVEVRTLPGRSLLVVADLAAPRLHMFDVSNCTQPVRLSSFALAATPHEFFLWSGGGRTLAYVATFSHPDLIVVDLTEPAAPQEVFRWSAPATGAPGVLHSLSLSPDGSRAYLALWDGGLAVADVVASGIDLHRQAEAGVPALWFHNTHSALPLRDPRFVLLTAEIYTCPFGGVAIADISDPAHPQIVSQVRLPENRCGNLPQSDAVYTAHNPLIVGDLVFLSWYGGGLQVLDVSNPLNPYRVGQFVPAGEGAAASSYVGTYPVQTWSYPILRDGLIYVVDIQSGLYVLRYTGPGAAAVAAVPRAEGNVTVMLPPN